MIVTKFELLNELTHLRRVRCPIVTTCGCFEIIHSGHIYLLKEASSLGTLIVLLNSDESVARVKGPGKCIVSASDRANVLNSIRYITYVTMFDETTPCNILSEIRPNIHVKGGDYVAEKIPEYNIVIQYGGRVQIIPTLKDKSTTNIIEHILALNGLTKVVE